MTLTALLLFGSIMVTSADPKKKSDGARPAFESGSNTLGFSIGLGDSYDYYGNVTRLPAFSVNFDHGIVDNVGPGTIGIGGVIGYQSTYYNYSSGGYKARWTNFVIGARGTYHLTLLKDKNNKFDPYGGVTVGFRSVNYTDDYYSNGLVNPHSFNSGPYFGVFVGAKYNFTPNFGAFSELGYDISFFRIGLHMNF